MSKRIDDLMAMEKKRQDAFVAGDADTLDAILTDDFVYLHSTGFSEGKEPFLDRIREKRSTVHRIDMRDVKVREYAHCAIMEGACDMPYEAWDGTKGETKSYFVATWLDGPGGWTIAAYASAPRGAPPAFDNKP